MGISRAAIGAALILTMTLAGSALASIVTADVIIDLNTAISGNTWIGFGHPLVSPVQVTTGDTVVINIGFAPGQAIGWSSNGYFSPWLMLASYPSSIDDGSQIGSFNWANTSVTLNGLTQGTQFPVSQLADGFNGSIHLGPTFTLGNDNVARTFSGATVSFTATWTEPNPTRDYSTIGYDFYTLFGGRVSVEAIEATVPELTSLATWATIATAALGGVFIRQRRKAAGAMN